jgi:hypothetical protein
MLLTPVGTAQPRGFVFDQIAASDAWMIVHNLGYYPGGVTVVDTGGNKVLGEVQYLSQNTLLIRFSAPFSGQAILS